MCLLCASLRVGRNGTPGLETSLKLRFKGTRQVLARSTPSSQGLNTVIRHQKASSLAHGEVTRGLEGKADIDAPCSCRANDVSMIVESETISPHKKKLFEVTTEKKKKREKMNGIEEKRQQQQQQQIKKTRSVCRENVQSQVHELRDRSLATKGDRPSPKQAELAVKWSNILPCLCNATIDEKTKKKKGNS